MNRRASRSRPPGGAVRRAAHLAGADIDHLQSDAETFPPLAGGGGAARAGRSCCRMRVFRRSLAMKRGFTPRPDQRPASELRQAQGAWNPIL